MAISKTVVKKVIVSNGNEPQATDTQTIQYLIYFVLGVLEVLLAFRLIFKLTGANPISGFVNLIYSLSNIFILPFQGIFHSGFAQGVETTSVLEPATLVAMVVYGIVAWGIIYLVIILSGERTN